MEQISYKKSFQQTDYSSEKCIFATMKYNVKDIFEYTFILIDLFARKFNLTEAQSYRYLKDHNGIGFIEQNYGILHTLNFPDAIEGLSLYCKKNGGTL